MGRNPGREESGAGRSGLDRADMLQSSATITHRDGALGVVAAIIPIAHIILLKNLMRTIVNHRGIPTIDCVQLPATDCYKW
jgi:hypothetical protein